jgi:hypothetical protein
MKINWKMVKVAWRVWTVFSCGMSILGFGLVPAKTAAQTPTQNLNIIDVDALAENMPKLVAMNYGEGDLAATTMKVMKKKYGVHLFANFEEHCNINTSILCVALGPVTEGTTLSGSSSSSYNFTRNNGDTGANGGFNSSDSSSGKMRCATAELLRMDLDSGGNHGHMVLAIANSCAFVGTENSSVSVSSGKQKPDSNNQSYASNSISLQTPEEVAAGRAMKSAVVMLLDSAGFLNWFTDPFKHPNTSVKWLLPGGEKALKEALAK